MSQTSYHCSTLLCDQRAQQQRQRDDDGQQRHLRVGCFDHQPMSALTSTLRSYSEPVPMAMASATMPSMRPVDFCLSSLRLLSSREYTTAFMALAVSTG